MVTTKIKSSSANQFDNNWPSALQNTELYRRQWPGWVKNCLLLLTLGSQPKTLRHAKTDPSLPLLSIQFLFYFILDSNKISIGTKVLVENHVKNHSHKACPLFLYSTLFLILHRFMDKLWGLNDQSPDLHFST